MTDARTLAATHHITTTFIRRRGQWLAEAGRVMEYGATEDEAVLAVVARIREAAPVHETATQGTA